MDKFFKGLPCLFRRGHIEAIPVVMPTRVAAAITLPV